MAERLVRFYGPAVVSASKSSPTTLFTVPNNKTYILRASSMVIPAATGGSPQGTSFVAGVNGVDTDDLIVGLGAAGSSVGAATETVNLVTPIVQGENVKGYYSTGGYGVLKKDVAAGETTSWTIATTTDAASFSTGSVAYQELGDPTNLYFVITNTKASAPDAVSSIVDNHVTNPFTNTASIVSVATATGRSSIWGAYAGTDSSGSATYTVNFGGNTQTSAHIKGIAVSGAALAVGSPGTGNVILQTATNSGTTQTSQGVTMTPTAGADSWQLMVVQTEGNQSITYTAAGGTTVATGGNQITPSHSAAAFFFYPAVTNPTAVADAAGTTWECAVIEGASAGVPTVTLSGLVIE